MIITSADVLNIWVVPFLGVKCDVVLGHLNWTSLFILFI
jgi:heme/copper-type cytochrome/quinol oxidase subunit 2